jgi:hypothetical protein
VTTDLKLFESALTELILACGVDEYVHRTAGHTTARLLVVIELMKNAHEQERDFVLSLAPHSLMTRFVPGTNQPWVTGRSPSNAERQNAILGPVPEHDFAPPFELGDVRCKICGETAGRHGDPLPASPPLLPNTGATVARRRTVHIEQREVPDPPAMPEPLRSDDCECGWSDEPHLRSEHEPQGVETLTPLED